MKNIFLTFSLCVFGSLALFAQSLNCNPFVNVSLDPNGMATLTPDMLTEGDISGFTLEVSLNHPVIQNLILIPAAPTIVVDCNYLGTYHFEITDVNTGISCWGMVNFEDVLGSCITEFGPDTYSLYYELKNAVSLIDTDVTLNGNPVNEVYDWLDTITYADLLPGENVLSFPATNEQFPLLSAVSTLDIVELVKMFYLSQVDFPLQAVVMDVDGSGYIGIDDILELRKLVLGVTTNLPGLDFLFVSETYEFTSDFNAFDFTDLNFREYKFDRDLVTKADLKFNTYKLGNINDGSGVFVVSDSLGGEPVASTRGLRELSIQDKEVVAGETVDVLFKFEANGSQINVFQLGLQFEGLELLNVESLYSNEIFAYNHISNDDLRFVYASSGENEFEMILQFEAQENGMLSDFISLNNGFEQLIGNYEGQDNIELEFNNVTSTEEIMTLSSTVLQDQITVQLSSGHLENVMVNDVIGRSLQSLTPHNNQIIINRSLFTHAGVYYISTSSKGKVVSNRIIVL